MAKNFIIERPFWAVFRASFEQIQARPGKSKGKFVSNFLVRVRINGVRYL